MGFWIKYEMIKKRGFTIDYNKHVVTEHLPKTQIVSNKEDRIKLSNDYGYKLNRKIYPWTWFTDWWLSLSMTNRITIVISVIGIIITLIIAYITYKSSH